MNTRASSLSDLHLSAGDLCLDFANTAAWHASDAPQERLVRYEDLVAWGRRIGLLNSAQAGRLLIEAGRRPAEAAAVLRRTVSVREAFYRMIVAILQRRTPAARDFSRFNRELKFTLRHARIVPGPKGISWDWETHAGDLEAMLWPILVSAADLLTSERRHRIGQCADESGCGWLFLDTTRNHSRRWCEMSDCGNRAKARRHYRRNRSLAARGGSS